MSSTALITGASQGIGKATALLFAKNGYDLIITARTKDRLDSTAEQIKSYGGQVLAIATDISDRSAATELVNLGIEHFSAITINLEDIQHISDTLSHFQAQIIDYFLR